MASAFTDANDSTLRHTEGDGLLTVQVMRFLMASNCEKRAARHGFLHFEHLFTDSGPG